MSIATHESMDRERWKQKLRVRLKTFTGGVPAESEGIVVEFFGPLGERYWQVEFLGYGVINVAREDLAVLDAAFGTQQRRQSAEKLAHVLRTAVEASLLLDYVGMIERLQVRDAHGRCETFRSPSEVRKLVQLLRERKIPVRREIRA